ncbi:MAG: hypothetical protein DDT37_01510 [Firmicutes bacterium]|nr:hypothetical protein [candidate division NPL-UPA2 bacterium]
MSVVLENVIQKTATEPASVSVDGSSVTAQRVADQIKADRYLDGQRAVTKNHFGLRFVKLEPPGAG